MYLIKAPNIVLTPCSHSHRTTWQEDHRRAAAGGMEQTAVAWAVSAAVAWSRQLEHSRVA